MKLYRQKEQLKKDILKKRIVLEKELQIEIQKELATELSNRTSVVDERNGSEHKEYNINISNSPVKKRYITYFI